MAGWISLSVESCDWRKKEIFHQHCWLDCAPVLLTQICAGPFENQSRLIQNYLKYNYSLANDIGNIITRICCAPHMPYCIYAQLIKCLMVANTWCQAKAEFAFSISAQRPFQLMPGISLVTLILENMFSLKVYSRGGQFYMNI